METTATATFYSVHSVNFCYWMMSVESFLYIRMFGSFSAVVNTVLLRLHVAEAELPNILTVVHTQEYVECCNAFRIVIKFEV